MKYIAGLTFVATTALFVYLGATTPNDDVELGFGMGVLVTAALFAAAGWLGYTLRNK